MSTTTDGVINNKKVTSLLDLVAKEEKIPNPEYDVTHTMKKGDGYMSVIYNAKIKDNGKEVLSVIAKICPENKIFREQTSITTLYENETLFYNEIYPAFYKFQIETGIKGVFDYAPKCYMTRLEEESEGLILENLRDKGYSVWDRMVSMDENHIELTLKAYAKYHALNFAFKDQHKEQYNDFCSRIQDVFEKFANHPSHREVYDKLIRSTISYLDPVEDKKYVEKFRNYIEYMDSQREMFFSKNMDEYSIIGHGDCWCNNMMYKYGDPIDPTKPTKVCLLDFQIIRYSTPITDVTHYFYTSCSKKALNNIEYYLSVYYNTLRDFIKQLGSDPEKVYPRSIFNAHWKKYCINGLNVAMFMIKVMTSESDEVPDFQQAAENESIMSAIDYEPKNSDYRKRIRDIILHFCEKGFI